MRHKLQKQSVLKLAGRIIPQSGGYYSARDKKQDLIFGAKQYKKQAAKQKLR